MPDWQLQSITPETASRLPESKYHRMGGWLLVLVLWMAAQGVNGLAVFVVLIKGLLQRGGTLTGGMALYLALQLTPVLLIGIALLLLFCRKLSFRIPFTAYALFEIAFAITNIVENPGWSIAAYALAAPLFAAWIVYFFASDRVRVYCNSLPKHPVPMPVPDSGTESIKIRRNNTMQTIGFIGIGVMGASMAGHLLDGGYALSVYTRTRAKAEALVARGATWRATVADCVRDADAVITMVGYPKDIEEVYFGEAGVIQNAKPGAILIDMTTTDPALAVRIHDEAAARGLLTLDAPVSGGDVGARNAALSIMAGGDRAAFDAAMPLFTRMGKTITYTGEAGSGQHTKMANQIAIAGAIAGVCEAVTYARANGLNVQNMLDCIGGGAAGSWQLANMAPRMLKGDYAPGFFIKHQTKDLHLAQKGAAAAHIDLPVLDSVTNMYDALERDGKGDCGTQALIQYYENGEGK